VREREKKEDDKEEEEEGGGGEYSPAFHIKRIIRPLFPFSSITIV